MASNPNEIGYLHRILVTLQRIERLLMPLMGVNTLELFIINDQGQKVRMSDMAFGNIAKTYQVFVEPRDLKGNLAKVDGLPEWSNLNPEVAEMVVAADGMSAMLKSVDGKLGVQALQVKADADLGEGVRTLLAEGSIEWVAGEAVSMALVFKEVVEPTPVPQPVPAPEEPPVAATKK